jgi:hypothetical protein
MNCETCEGTGRICGAPDCGTGCKCPDCLCEGCGGRGIKIYKCATGGEMICEGCHNAETSDGCPVAKGESL